jgi:hypothetical protein
MHWQLTRGNNAKLVYQDPDTGRFVTRIFRGDDYAKGAAAVLIRQREENRRIIEEGKETEHKLNSLEQIVNQIIQQHLICSGFIYRHNRWQRVKNLKQPLTQEERNLIRRTKSKTETVSSTFDLVDGDRQLKSPPKKGGVASEITPSNQSKLCDELGEVDDSERCHQLYIQNETKQNRHENAKTENVGSNFDDVDGNPQPKSPPMKGGVASENGLETSGETKNCIQSKVAAQQHSNFNHNPKATPVVSNESSTHQTGSANDSYQNQRFNSQTNMTNTKEHLEDLSYKHSLNDEELAEVQRLLGAEPSLWKEFGDINEWIREKALQGIDDCTVKYLSVKKGLEVQRENLLSEGSSPLEVIAIEQIITCQLQLALSGIELENIKPCKELAAMSNHWIRVNSQANTRLFRAINTLLRLRRLNLQNTVFKQKHRHLDFNPNQTQENRRQNEETENVDSNLDVPMSPIEEHSLLLYKESPCQKVPQEHVSLSSGVRNHSKESIGTNDSSDEADDSQVYGPYSDPREPEGNRHQGTELENVNLFVVQEPKEVANIL